MISYGHVLLPKLIFLAFWTTVDRQPTGRNIARYCRKPYVLHAILFCTVGGGGRRVLAYTYVYSMCTVSLYKLRVWISIVNIMRCVVERVCAFANGDLVCWNPAHVHIKLP